ncbi:MAG: hypothetical protein PHF35_00875 [Candidatus Moranbacteria bacterium]|nr:hypothetical protein [Candidatus Moranbacteria bacterium]
MNLQKNIIQTIIYYDILDFPLTSFEIWKNLIGERKCSLGEITETLESSELENRIEEYNGFYFLHGRKELVAWRIQADKDAGLKFEIAEKAAKWLRFAPYVRMVALTGTLAMKNCEKDSDIDFFVVLEKGRIFTGRLLATAMTHVLGRRRYGKKVKNRICLNYFVATDSLKIERQDLFAANEYTFVFLLFSGSAGRDFYRANFDWIKKFKPNWEIPELAPARYHVDPTSISRFAQKALERLINSLGGDRIETWLKCVQIARIGRNPLTRKDGAYVRANEKNLIFLPDPQGVRIEKEWQKRIKS